MVHKPGADLLPHEFLLKISQGDKFVDFEETPDGKYVPKLWRPAMKDRIDCAKAAAPYFAPRLQAVKHSGDSEADPIKVEVSDNEVARRVAFLLSQGGSIPSADSEE